MLSSEIRTGKSPLEERDNSLMEPAGNTTTNSQPKPSTTLGQAPKKAAIHSEDVERINLLEVNENNLLEMPIDAISFEVPAMLQVTPKDKSYVFRWVNFKGHEGSNYSRFKVMGFTNVTADEVDGPIADGFVKDGESIVYCLL